MWITHPGCAGWDQRGNQTSHCANCHQTFTSLEGFDHHQVVMPDRTVYAAGVECFPAPEMTRTDGGGWYTPEEGRSPSEIQWSRARPGKTHWMSPETKKPGRPKAAESLEKGRSPHR